MKSSELKPYIPYTIVQFFTGEFPNEKVEETFTYEGIQPQEEVDALFKQAEEKSLKSRVSWYTVSEPEYFGVMPIRQDIEVIPCSEVENKDIGWYTIPNGIKPRSGNGWYEGEGYDLIRAKDYNEFVRNKDNKEFTSKLHPEDLKSYKRAYKQITGQKFKEKLTKAAVEKISKLFK